MAQWLNDPITHSLHSLNDSIAFQIAMLVDAVADAVATAIAGDTVLEPGLVELHEQVHEHLLADDVVLASALVLHPQVAAGLPRAAVGRFDVEPDVGSFMQLRAVPEG